MRIPDSYVPETHQRLGLYKRMSELRSPAEIDALRGEIRDRFGPLPPEVEGLLPYAALRPRAEAAKVSQVDFLGGRLVVRFASEFPLDTLPALVRALPGATLTPQALHVPLPAGEDRGRRRSTLSLPGWSGAYNRRGLEEPRGMTHRLAVAAAFAAAMACREGRPADPVILELGDDVVRRSDFAAPPRRGRGAGTAPPCSPRSGAACSTPFSSSACSCSRRGRVAC